MKKIVILFQFLAKIKAFLDENNVSKKVFTLRHGAGEGPGKKVPENYGAELKMVRKTCKNEGQASFF